LAEGPLADRLDALVTANRFTIAVVFPLVGAGLLLASAAQAFPPALGWLSFNPWLILVGVAVMRSPLIAGLVPLLDRRLGLALAGLAAYTYGIEAVGVATGWPYGPFTYEVALGPTVAGVPVFLAVLFVPLVFDAHLLVVARQADLGPIGRWLATAGLVVGLDLVLDPGAVALGFWRYLEAGAYHGVPWQNYAGWGLAALVTAGLVELGLDHEALADRLASCPFVFDDLVSFLLLWGTINLVFAQLVPVLVALGLGLALLTAPGFQVHGLPRNR
jgi:putative membrane protein